MDFTLPFLLFCLLVSSAAADCDRCMHQSKAAFYRSLATMASGACGYKSDVLELSGRGYAGSGTPKLFKGGVGCGACYQIRCKDSVLCSTSGVKVVLTDSQGNDKTDTDFVLSLPAFIGMAKSGMTRNLTKLGVVEIDYRRVPCVYEYPLSVKVEGQSNKPYYLAIKLLRQGGQTDITSVQVARVGSDVWVPMNRSYGAVWDTNQVPLGELTIRVAVTSGQWYTANKVVLPADWKNGDSYDTGLQITEIAQEKCYPCDTSIWN